MKVGVTGASGFIGGAVVAEILANNNEAIGFSRSPNRSLPGCSEVREFSPDHNPDLSGLDALVHLAGESLMGLWTKDKKEEILQSRVESTQRIIDALWAMDSAERPSFFGCASAVGIYGNRGDDWLDEESDAGFGFLAEVAKAWESVAHKAADMGVRTVHFRIGFVLGENGGAIPVMKKVFSKGLGGTLGNGKQWMPWIHVDDVAGIIQACLENDLIRGPVNVTGPHPVTNRELTHALAHGLGKSTFLPVPAFALKMLPGGMSEMFLNSLRVEPTVMKSYGYQWEYPDLKGAIAAAL